MNYNSLKSIFLKGLILILTLLTTQNVYSNEDRLLKQNLMTQEHREELNRKIHSYISVTEATEVPQRSEGLIEYIINHPMAMDKKIEIVSTIIQDSHLSNDEQALRMFYLIKGMQINLDMQHDFASIKTKSIIIGTTLLVLLAGYFFGQEHYILSTSPAFRVLYTEASTLIDGIYGGTVGAVINHFIQISKSARITVKLQMQLINSCDTHMYTRIRNISIFKHLRFKIK